MSGIRKPSIPKLVRVAKAYQDNLLNKNFLLVGVNGEDVDTLELRFLSRHFKHLTGVRTNPRSMSSNEFFRLCARSRLSDSQLEPDYSGNAGLKLDAALSMFREDLAATAFGQAQGGRKHIVAEVFAGGRAASMGFTSSVGPFYDPVTLLRSPIREEVLPRDLYKIECVLSKGVYDSSYSVVRIGGETDWDCLLDQLPKEVRTRISV